MSEPGNNGGTHTPENRKGKTLLADWGGRIRTSAWRNRSPAAERRQSAQQQHSFLMVNSELQASVVIHGESHEKWIKEKSLDVGTGPRAEDLGPQENPRRANCQEVEADRGSNA